MTRARAIGLALAALVVGLAVYLRVVVWPWVAAPEPARVAAAWSAVEDAAKVRAPAPAADARWDALVSAANAARPSLEQIAERGDAPSDVDGVPADARAALDGLAAWARGASTDEAPITCPPQRLGGPTMISLLSLARAALRLSPVDARSPMLAKVSERLRRRGTYFDYVVGMTILEELLNHAGPGSLPPYLREAAADGAELLSAVARDEVCFDEVFNGMPAVSPALSGPASNAPWLARLVVRPSRERAMVRLYWGEQLRAAREVKDDPAALAARLTVLGDPTGADLPPSIVVRIAARNYPVPVSTMTRWRDRAAARGPGPH